jgi:hypothetical protein
VTSRESIEVRHASHDKLPAVVAVLSRAFFTDRIYCWMVPDDVAASPQRRCVLIPVRRSVCCSRRGTT